MTIVKIEHLKEKRRILITLNDDYEVMIKTNGLHINESHLFNKNHKFIDYTHIKNIQIKDIGWEVVIRGLFWLFIVDINGDVYRTSGETHFTGTIPKIYDYTDHKRIKADKKEKDLVDKLKTTFIKKYDIIT